MAAFERASIVLVDFPFSDLSDFKLRPALILAQANSQDWILCQITSNAAIDKQAIEIKKPRILKKVLCEKRVLHDRTKFSPNTKV